MAFKEGQPPPANSKPFTKGVSGNPAGRSKGIERQLREQYGKDAPTIVGVLVKLALGEDVDGYKGIKPNERLTAAHEALDRVAGKATQTIDGSFDLGASPEQLALLAALQMTPQERRNKLAQIDAEDRAALEQSTEGNADDPDE